MRCSWTIGCPTEIRPEKKITKLEAALEADNERANTEASYSYAFKQLFPGQEVPDAVGNHCGAQFALARWKVLERPKEDYIRYRDWLYNTPLKDSVSGRILEYSWHSKHSWNRTSFVMPLTVAHSDLWTASNQLSDGRRLLLSKIRLLQSDMPGRWLLRETLPVTPIRYNS